MKKKLIGLMVLALLMVTASAPAAAMGNPASEGMAALAHSFQAIFFPAQRAPHRKVLEGPMFCAAQMQRCQQNAANTAARCERTSLSCMLTDNVWCDCVDTYNREMNDCQTEICNPYVI